MGSERPTRRPTSATRTPAQRQVRQGPRAAAPGGATMAPAEMQRRYGNAGTQALLAQRAAAATTAAYGPIRVPPTQPKVAVGPPGDTYEREADAAARRVATGQPVQRISRLPVVGPALAQRRCIACEEEMRQGGTAAPVQRAATPAGGPESERLDIDRAATAMARSGAGRPLAPPMRARMDQSFGHDLKGVRVHTDTPAHEASAALNARAFTRGSNIYFGRGQSPRQPEPDGARTGAYGAAGGSANATTRGETRTGNSTPRG